MRFSTSIAGRVFANVADTRKRKLLANRLGITRLLDAPAGSCGAGPRVGGGPNENRRSEHRRTAAHGASLRCRETRGYVWRPSCLGGDWGLHGFRECQRGWTTSSHRVDRSSAIEGMARSLSAVSLRRAAGLRHGTPRGARGRDLLDLDLGAGLLELLLDVLGLVLRQSLLDGLRGQRPRRCSLASLRPRPVMPRTTLMTLIFLSPESARMTSNSVFSSAASAAAPPATAPTAITGADASTPSSVLEGPR